MKRNAHAIQSRREQILSKVRESGNVSVYEMSRIFDVSESTIRRDIGAIEDDCVVRYHGGLKINGRESVFEEKNALSSEYKEAIARKAAGMVQDGQTVFLNAGTTTLALFRQLKDRDICIITNNTATVMEFVPFRADLLLVGGQYRVRSRSLVGGMASQSLSQAYADVCFLGTNGVSLERGLTTILHQEADVNRAMAERARSVICIADSSKFGIDAGFVSMPLAKVSAIITDVGIAPEMRLSLEKTGTSIILADAGNSA